MFFGILGSAYSVYHRAFLEPDAGSVPPLFLRIFARALENGIADAYTAIVIMLRPRAPGQG